VWRVYPTEGCYDKCGLTGLWSTQVKVEGIMLKAAWHWGRDCSIVNDPLGEPGCTPLYVGLPSAWGSVEGDCMFFSILWEGSFLGTMTDINELYINYQLDALTIIYS